jgi:hypothetical protein
MRATGMERVKVAVGAPREVAAQIGVGVVAGSALEPGKLGGHREPRPVSMLHQGGRGGD